MTGRPIGDPDAEAFLAESGTIAAYFFNNEIALAPGPYMKLDGQLWEVCRLVDDSYETCMVALKPQENLLGSFERLSIMGQDSNVLSFAIPSRLKYSIPNQQLPLAGKRILIKDNIHLDGIKTSNGNRAFYETYPAQTQTASCIQKLIDKGVVVIGKTKMSAFGNWEEPIQYTDYPAPWNPRADRYQSPGGSSSGSASAVAAYEWLDIAIGTDTWGSVTRPALWCGCFGLRPSLGAISADGIVPCVRSWDIPGILARDLEDCKHFAEEWLDFNNNKFKEYPQEFSCLLWPTDFWESFEATEKEMAKTFAKNMADKLGVCLREFSFENCWKKEGPEGWRKDSLQEFMKETTQAMAYDSFNSSEDFRTRYKEKTRAEPYTAKPNEDTWSIGKKTSRQTRDDAFARIDIYQQWFKDHFFTDERKRTISAITILPLDIGGPRYRDDCPRDDDPSDNDPSDNNHRHNDHIDGFSSDHVHRDKRPGEGSHISHASINAAALGTGVPKLIVAMCKFIVAYLIINKTIVTKITNVIKATITKIIKTTITKTTKITKIITTKTTVRISEDHTNQASTVWHLGLSWEPLFSPFQLAKYRTIQESANGPSNHHLQLP
ncbi:hypothetical protein Trihar35433_5712 [Trichoderma harzianum]|nr:hypothetical protein Trihar35433_5712 [Trichoderma harzianum]